MIELFQEDTSHFNRFTEIHYTPTLSSALFCDNFVKLTAIFVILLHETVVYQKLIKAIICSMLIIKKLTKQCAPCSTSIMILQKGVAVSLEGRHLVLTLLASIRLHERIKIGLKRRKQRKYSK